MDQVVLARAFSVCPFQLIEPKVFKYCLYRAEYNANDVGNLLFRDHLKICFELTLLIECLLKAAISRNLRMRVGQRWPGGSKYDRIPGPQHSNLGSKAERKRTVDALDRILL